MDLKEYRKLPGVADLPVSIGGPFAIALKAEDEGNAEKAE